MMRTGSCLCGVVRGELTLVPHDTTHKVNQAITSTTLDNGAASGVRNGHVERNRMHPREEGSQE